MKLSNLVRSNAIKVVFLALLTGAVFFACSPAEQDTATSGEQDLIILLNSDVVSLDPHGSNDSPSSNVRRQIYDTLVVFDADMNLLPGLAT
jgi:peptide/nickel transport system substrate-binding protein